MSCLRGAVEATEPSCAGTAQKSSGATVVGALARRLASSRAGWAAGHPSPGRDTGQLFCSLFAAVLSLCPGHERRKAIFKTREAFSLLMLFWSSFKLMRDFFTLYAPKSYIWTLKMLQGTVLRKCRTVPCTPNILQNIRNRRKNTCGL